MIYSEYYNKNDYKIKIDRKSYFLRDALKLYLNQLSNESEIHNVFEKIINIIIDIIKDNEFQLDIKNRVILDNSMIIELAKKNYIACNLLLTNRILKFFIKHNIISKKSKLLPKVYKEYDSNKLTNSFIGLDLSVFDPILDLRDEILEIIQNTDDESNRELYLYFYLKLFSIKKYKENVYLNFNRANLYDLDGTIVLIYKNVFAEENLKVVIEYFDEKLNMVLKNTFFNESDNLFDKIDHYFEKDINYYEKQFENFLKDFFIKIKGSAKYHKSKFKRLIKKQIELEYQFHNTALHNTLQEHKLYPKTSYIELVRLFPDKLKNKEYIRIEKENIEKQKTTSFLDEDEQIEMGIQNYMDLDIDIYDEFKKFKKFYVSSKREYSAFEIKLEKFIEKNKESFAFPEMFYFIRTLIRESRFSDSAEKQLESSTLRSKLSIIFFSCFDLIIKEGIFDDTVVEIIASNVENYQNKKTRQKYIPIINEFLNKFEFGIGDSKGTNLIYARKSLIFKVELDELHNLYLGNDTPYFNEDIFIETTQKFMFCMLMYYSGTRESELWSREVRDVYIIDDKVTIDIHKNGLVKNLKTYSAKHRVEFNIEDPKYLELFKRYLSILEKRDIKYFFPDFSKQKKIMKKTIKKIGYFKSCNVDIKTITGRYTSLHSFRHTFATNGLRKIFNSNDWEKKDLYNLINMVGHLGPEVTLRFYMHIDYVLNYRNITIF